jgi:hypothetical protein
MKTTLCSLMIFAALAGPVTLRAGDVSSDDLCAVSRTHELAITTVGGTLKGTCYRTTEASITLETPQGVKTVERVNILAARLDNFHKSHCLAGATETIGYGFESATAIARDPELIVIVPVLVVVGAAETPICAVYDLINRLSGSHEITIV